MAKYSREYKLIAPLIPDWPSSVFLQSAIRSHNQNSNLMISGHSCTSFYDTSIIIYRTRSPVPLHTTRTTTASGISISLCSAILLWTVLGIKFLDNLMNRFNSKLREENRTKEDRAWKKRMNKAIWPRDGLRWDTRLTHLRSGWSGINNFNVPTRCRANHLDMCICRKIPMCIHETSLLLIHLLRISFWFVNHTDSGE